MNIINLKFKQKSKIKTGYLKVPCLLQLKYTAKAAVVKAYFCIFYEACPRRKLYLDLRALTLRFGESCACNPQNFLNVFNVFGHYVNRVGN